MKSNKDNTLSSLCTSIIKWMNVVKRKRHNLKRWNQNNLPPNLCGENELNQIINLR